MKEVVSNTTALIAFSNIGRLDILQKVYGKIYIPTAVYNEVKTYSLPRWIERKSIQSHRSYELLIFNFGLHPGEAEAIILADELNRKIGVKALLIDENMGRAVAKKVFGNQNYPKLHSVLHTCKIAEKLEIIPSAMELYFKICRAGYRPNADDKKIIFRVIKKSSS